MIYVPYICYCMICVPISFTQYFFYFMFFEIMILNLWFIIHSLVKQGSRLSYQQIFIQKYRVSNAAKWEKIILLSFPKLVRFYWLLAVLNHQHFSIVDVYAETLAQCAFPLLKSTYILIPINSLIFFMLWWRKFPSKFIYRLHIIRIIYISKCSHEGHLAVIVVIIRIIIFMLVKLASLLYWMSLPCECRTMRHKN